ncbi:HAD-like domain-containing protein [Dichotomocladium elegans]|nr:HAD-like domain-containing protein [Dichotomocladium elegans]
MRSITSLCDILESSKYSTIACDIYGVLHNGVKPYPFSRDCLRQLTDSGECEVVLLSNSTRLGHMLERDLETKYGILRNSYSEILSSGDLTQLFLKHCVIAWTQDQCDMSPCNATAFQGEHSRGFYSPAEFVREHWKSGRFFLMGRDDYHGPLYRPFLPTLTRVDDWQDDAIDFVILGMIVDLAGSPGHVNPYDEQSVREHYRAFLEHHRARDTVFVCANPDVWAPNGERGLLACPGFIAQLYRDLGGTVLYFGKPFPTIYCYLLNAKASGASRRVLCVGDNVSTDVQGARQAGLDVVMVLGGVHADHIDLHDPDAALADVRELCAKYKTMEPTFIMPYMKYE